MKKLLLLILTASTALVAVACAEDMVVFAPDNPSIHNQVRREKINGEWHTFTYGTFGRDEAVAPTRFGHMLRRGGLTDRSDGRTHCSGSLPLSSI